MKWVLRLLLMWAVLSIVLVALAFAASEGEPVCKGPLIDFVNASNPPRCDDPIDRLPSMAPLILAASLGLSGVATTVTAAIVQARSKRS